MTGPRRTRRARQDPPEILSPFDVMSAPELAALALLEHALHVARIAMLAQHVELLEPDASFQPDAQPGAELTTSFFARSYALSVVIRRYRTAVAQAAVALDGAHDDRDDPADDDF